MFLKQIIILCVLTGWLAALLPVEAGGATDEQARGARFDYRRWHSQVHGNKFKITVSHKVTILNERGQDYSELSFTDDDFSKLKSVLVKVLDSEGRIIYKKTKHDLTKACGYAGYSLYDDLCTYYGTFKAQRFPYSIEYEYEKEYKSLFYLTGATFQSWLPVTSASYTLEKPADLGLRYRTTGLASEMEPRVENKGQTLIWEIENLPGQEDIDCLPPGALVYAGLHFALEQFRFGKYDLDGRSWNSVGASLSQLTQDRYLDGAREIPATTNGDRQTAEQIYNEIIADIRYVAIEIGIGGFRPYAAKLTAERGFGDCKDMSTLLVSRLRLAGIEAYSAHLLTRGNEPLWGDFPVFGFNHVICMALVEGDTVWMDPTCNDCPMGELLLTDEDVDIVVSATDGGVLCRTPASQADQNTLVRNSAFHIDAEKIIGFTSEIFVEGNYAVFLRQTIDGLDTDETRRFVNRLFPGAEKKFVINSYLVENIDDLYLPVRISIEATMKRPARQLGGVLYCAPFLLNKLAAYEMVKLEDRAYPVKLYCPESEIDNVVLTWDASLAIDSVALPATDSLRFSFGAMRMTSSRVADTVSLSLEREYYGYEVPYDQLEQYATFRDKLKKAFRQPVKLIQ